jgi:hypothetical protein
VGASLASGAAAGREGGRVAVVVSTEP